MTMYLKFGLGDFVETYEKKDFYLKHVSIRTICEKSVHLVLQDKIGKVREYEIFKDDVDGSVEYSSRFALGDNTNKGVIRAIFFTKDGNLYLTNDYKEKFKENELIAG